jgi:16S rRNA (guanine(966)-N(2))-methyltransferase RsmD
MDTRPTLDRVKESLFGILQFDIADSCVLDLFSGSGNLGLEAASRGARRVVCNDRSRECAEQIRKNAVLLGLQERVETRCMDYSACIERMQREGLQFDFVFLDAPYADGTAARAAEIILASGILKNGGRVIIEHAKDLRPDVKTPPGRIAGRRDYGTCAISFYEKT